MSQSYRLKLSRPALKMRVSARIPASLSVTSPLTLDKTGADYEFGLDVDTLRASFDPLYQPVDQTLTGLAGLDSSAGIVVQTAADTFTKRSLAAPAAGITITNPAGTAGNPTLVLADDLAALEGLASTGIARRTGLSAWSVGTAVANSELATAAAYTIKGNATGSSATPTDIDIAALTTKGSPASGDYLLLSDQAASGALKKATVTSLVGSSGVTSIAGNTGAFTLSGGIVNSTNDIHLDRGQLPGEASTSSATAGNIGELVTSTITGTTTSLSSGSVVNITSITLSAGDWDISAILRYTTGGSTTTTDVLSAVATANNVVTGGSILGIFAQTRVASTADLATTHTFPPVRVSISGSTTYYLNCQATFAISTADGSGIIRARRMR